MSHSSLQLGRVSKRVEINLFTNNGGEKKTKEAGKTQKGRNLSSDNLPQAQCQAFYIGFLYEQSEIKGEAQGHDICSQPILIYSRSYIKPSSSSQIQPVRFANTRCTPHKVRYHSADFMEEENQRQRAERRYVKPRQDGRIPWLALVVDWPFDLGRSKSWQRGVCAGDALP